MPTNQQMFDTFVTPFARIAFHLVVIILLMGFFEIITRRLMMTSYARRGGLSYKAKKARCDLAGWGIRVVFAFIALLLMLHDFHAWTSDALHAANTASAAFQKNQAASREEKDADGRALGEKIDDQYSTYFRHDGNNCTGSFDRGGQVVDIELDDCAVDCQAAPWLTHADTLNGIDYKGTCQIYGKAYRVNQAGAWSEWSPNKPGELYLTNIGVIRKSGNFEFSLGSGFSRIRSYH